MESETVAPVFAKVKGWKNKMPNSGIVLYYFLQCPPCRSVMLLAKALEVEMKGKVINIMAGDQMTPEFLRLNPQHTIPTINDNGFILYESRAILQYLVDEYGKDDTLAPKDAKKAAIVNQRLYFDACTLTPRLLKYMIPVIKRGHQPNKEDLESFEEALEYMDEFLKGHSWIAGDNLTIADFAFVTSISTAEAVNVDISKFININVWYLRATNAMDGFGYDEINRAGCEIIAKLFKSKLK